MLKNLAFKFGNRIS